MEIGDFAEQMFLKNKNDKILHIDFIGIENNKDLFLCFIDLFCKGLVMCFGNHARTIDFDDLTQDKFAYIKKKMGLAGICVNLNITQTPIPTNTITSINTEEIDNEEDYKPLNEYVFRILRSDLLYEINFELEHKI